MSLKEIFAKKSNKVINNTSLQDVADEIESADLEKALTEEKNRFIPDVDFSSPTNFAKFGSAEKYYSDSIISIYSTYPYDGSLYEKTNWHNKSSDITNYIFDNLYPRNNGYINLGYEYGTIISSSDDYSITDNIEYIYIKGGPNKSEEKTLREQFGKANKIDVAKNRSYNIYINGETGLTTEFWLKKNDYSGSSKQVIFDVWNSSSYGSNSYGRFRIETRPGISGEENKFFLEIASGSNGISEVSLGSDLNLADSSWNHYAFNVVNSGSNLKIELFKNGNLNDFVLTGSAVLEVTGAYLATIGSLITSVSGTYGDLGFGKLSGSLDEFRFWKEKRNDKQIKRFWFTQVGAGTNTDDSNTNLGLYYKFNEGIFDTEQINVIDKKVIDYSGRVSNGFWSGYVIGSRNTGSAIVESAAELSEFKDPILYSTHPDVVSLMTEKMQEGKEYDLENNAAIINSFPQWMLDEDSEQLKNLSQLTSEYFDDLYLKIKYLPEIHNSAYISGKPLTFAPRLLESHGFTTSDIFVDSTVLESLLARNENNNYEEKLFNIKNFIYQNIYNNLNYIYRSKGTEKSIRNLIRCFGVDENLIKVNLYANDSIYTFGEHYSDTSVKKKYVDLNNPDRFEGTVYQYSSSDNSNSISYIPGDLRAGYNGTTFEIEIKVPTKFDIESPLYFVTDFLTSSIAGMHSADPTAPTNFYWSGSDPGNIELYLVRNETESKDAYFKLTSSYLGINLTSSVFNEIYNDEKWNLSVRFYHEKYPYSNQILGGETGSYIIEFTGYNLVSDSLQNSFKLTASIEQTIAEQHFLSNKRIYAGSHRQDFTGSLLKESDIRFSSVRYWLSKLTDEVLLEHTKDPLNFGSESPYNNVFNIKNRKFIPEKETLVLNWDFENVTGSDNGSGIGPSTISDGKFIVSDLTSGSINSGDFYWVGNIGKYEFLGRGDFFLRNKSNIIKRDYVDSLKRKQPESLNDTDMINILERDDTKFTRDTIPVQHYFTIEKSMYQTINDEIIKIFGLFSSLNNIVGEPVYRYEQRYKKLDNLRELFFERVENEVDLEKYIDFYKWFDQSIGDMIMQLIPASANFAPGLKTVVESHILERNKYWTKYPTIELKKEPPIDAVNGINELKYNWRTGHAPIPFSEDISCLWWKERAERIDFLNKDRQKLFDSSLAALNRKFNTVYDFKADPVTIIDNNSFRTDYVKGIIKFSSNSYLSIDASDIADDKDCDDK